MGSTATSLRRYMSRVRLLSLLLLCLALVDAPVTALRTQAASPRGPAARPAPAGLALVDMTAPYNPVDLGFFDTGPGPRGVHELDLTVQGGRALALLAVPGSESSGTGDLRIVDITDPRSPVQIADWGV